MKYPVYNNSGEQVKDIELSNRLFAVTPKAEVVHQVVLAQEANSRQVLAHTKTRSEVSGGGKKPWKQKGTGRARHGSTRSPIWVGGGITFGPRSDRNFTQKVNKKQKQLALAMCLSDKANGKTLVLLDNLSNMTGKTKDLGLWLANLKSKVSGMKDSKKVLLVMDASDAKLTKSAANLGSIKTISAKSLNCVDLLKATTVIASVKSIEEIEKHFKKVNEKKAETGETAKKVKKVAKKIVKKVK
ncbi:MAG: 50S ribosomal protein L4 [Candidatus Buchananbacteria bacterium]|jgi:large subunit ribosomal protein L4